MALVEITLGIAIATIAAGFAAPRLAAIADAADVRDEVLRVVVALDAARGAAARLDAVTTLTLADTAYCVRAVVAGDTVTAWRGPGPAARRVTLGGTGQPLRFGPAGLAMGVSNRTIVVRKGYLSRKVVVSKLGRVAY